MGWGKKVLFFQASVTLILGIIFLSQVISLDLSKIVEYKIEIAPENTSEEAPPEYIDLKQRYSAAAYILLFVSSIEIIIISKFLI